MCKLYTPCVCELASKAGIPWSIENPRTSNIWRGPLHRLHALPGVVEVFYEMCMFGSQFKKPTKLLTTFRILPELSRLCDGSHEHVLDQGSSKVRQPDGSFRWINRTTQAVAYSEPLCRRWSLLLSRVAPPRAAIPGATRWQEFEDALLAIQASHSVRSRPRIA